MKATLIKLDTKVVDIPDHRPFWRELVHDGMPLTANYQNMDLTTAPMMDVKTIDYRLVEIRGGKHGENGYYVVNDDMWYTAMPLLEDVVQKRLRPLEQENTELKVQRAKLIDEVRELENSWWERLKRFYKRVTTKEQL